MWFENIWNTSLFWWILLAVSAIGIIILTLLWRQRKKTEPLKKHLDHYCRCYARGELRRDDFEDLKRELQEYNNSSIKQKKYKSNA